MLAPFVNVPFTANPKSDIIRCTVCTGLGYIARVNVDGCHDRYERAYIATCTHAAVERLNYNSFEFSLSPVCPARARMAEGQTQK